MQKILVRLSLLIAAFLPLSGIGQHTISDMDEGVNLEVKLSKLEFPLSELEKVEITVSGTNLSGDTLDPRFHALEMWIHDQPSMAWQLTIGNGLRPMKWYKLPPGESVELTWSTLAASLFPEPGKYPVKIVFNDAVISEFNVRVLP